MCRLSVETHEARMEFEYNGGGIGKGCKVVLYVDGKKEGEGWVDQTMPFVYTLDETYDIGREAGSPDYGIHGNAFNGKVSRVQIDMAKDKFDHLISLEEQVNFALMGQ